MMVLVGAAVLVAGCQSVLGARAVPVIMSKLPNWQLATAFPTSAEVPAGWAYRVGGALTPATPVEVPAQKPSDPYHATFTPAECGGNPRIRVLAPPQNVAAKLALTIPDSSGRTEPTANFNFWLAPDGPAMIAEYRQWAQRCQSYRYDVQPPGGVHQAFTARIDPRPTDGVDAAVVDLTSDSGPGDVAPPTRTLTAYYAVGGVLLEVTSDTEGAARETVKRLADRTVQKLLALNTPPWETGPGLAALSGARLAGFLPDADAFPAGWDTELGRKGSESFGYSVGEAPTSSFAPADCWKLLPDFTGGQYVAAGAASRATARLRGREPIYDLMLGIARSFEPAAFDELVTRAHGCARFTGGPRAAHFTVTVLEDTKPADGSHRFRYAITRDDEDVRSDEAFADYFSFAQLDGLLVTGSGTDGHDADVDRLVDDTVKRVEEH